jgi:hypothetical protein
MIIDTGCNGSDIDLGVNAGIAGKRKYVGARKI